MDDRPVGSLTIKELQAVLKAKQQKTRTALGTMFGDQSLKVIPRRCLGCNEVFSATAMRTHPCSLSWPLRLGLIWDKDSKKYIPGPNATQAVRLKNGG